MRDCGPDSFLSWLAVLSYAFTQRYYHEQQQPPGSSPTFFNNAHHSRFLRCLFLAFCFCSLGVLVKDYHFASNVVDLRFWYGKPIWTNLTICATIKTELFKQDFFSFYHCCRNYIQIKKKLPTLISKPVLWSNEKLKKILIISSILIILWNHEIR